MVSSRPFCVEWVRDAIGASGLIGFLGEIIGNILSMTLLVCFLFTSTCMQEINLFARETSVECQSRGHIISSYLASIRQNLLLETRARGHYISIAPESLPISRRLGACHSGTGSIKRQSKLRSIANHGRHLRNISLRIRAPKLTRRKQLLIDIKTSHSH